MKLWTYYARHQFQTVAAKRKKEQAKKERAVTAQLMGKLRHDIDFLENLMIHPGLTKGQVEKNKNKMRSIKVLSMNLIF